MTITTYLDHIVKHRDKIITFVDKVTKEKEKDEAAIPEDTDFEY